MTPIADIDRIARGIGRAEVRDQSLFWRLLFNTTNSISTSSKAAPTESEVRDSASIADVEKLFLDDL
jgi:hypothetical protein